MSSFEIADALNIPELPTYLQSVDARVSELAGDPDPFINDPIARLLQVRGKRWRPTLVIAGALAEGGEVDEKTLSACAAIELIHISSLVHDDIIDHADTRWNIPTISKKEGMDRALLSGDYLFAKGCAEAAGISAEAAQIVTSAFAEVCRGQSMELADQYNLDRTEASLTRAIHGTTSAMFIASSKLGGLCANASDVRLQAFENFGLALGMSFQLADDVINLIGDTKLVGKPTASDIREGNYTLPVILGLQGPQRTELLQLLATPEKSFDIGELLFTCGAIEATIMRIRRHNQAAVDAFADLDNANDYKHLANMPSAFSNFFLESNTSEPYRSTISAMSSHSTY